MNLFFRLIKVLIGIGTKKPLGLLDESVIELRVWPNDLDINLHMTNGRYLTLMDLGRFDLIFRMGMLKHMIARRWRPVAASATIRFRRSLKLFQKVRIRSRLAYWDDQWVFFEQTFERDGKLVARAYVKALLRASDGNVPTARILEAMGRSDSSPPLPQSIAAWQESEAAERNSNDEGRSPSGAERALRRAQ